jgi:hypothetical protein
MSSTIRTVMLSWVAIGCMVAVARGEDPTAEHKYRAALVRAAKARETAVDAARAEYIASLKEQLMEETKKGNLDAAVALRAKVNQVEAQARAVQSIGKKLSGTKWVIAGGASFQWTEDGTLYHAGRERPWTPLDAQRVIVVVASGQVAILEFDERFTKFDQYFTRVNDKPTATGTRSMR